MHSLDEFTDPQFYKSFAELERKMHDVLGTEASTPVREEMASSPAPVMREMPAQNIEEAVAAPVAEAEEEDTMSYFAKLAAEA